jgi:iron(III) transport system substrate-binding protein
MTSSHLLLALALAISGSVQAQSAPVLNLYSARHYQTDEALYDNFSKSTGIKINRIDADDAGILARLKTEGAASPADVVLLVDAARLWRGELDGLFQPLKSKVLEARIPATLRGKDEGQGSQWFGFSTRARVVVYNKASVFGSASSS